jgi:Arylsulfotransferase (ASST)
VTHRWTIRRRAAGGVFRTRSSVAVLAAALVVALLGPVAPAAYAAAHTTTTVPSGNTTPASLPEPRPAAFDATGAVSAFPAPGTPTASLTTSITLRGPGAAALQTIQVQGASSGAHPGHFQPHPDGGGTTFVPDQSFSPGEQVTVTTSLAVRGATDGTYSFTVAHPSSFPATPLPAPKPASKTSPQNDLLHFVTRPDLTPPNLKVTTTPDHAGPGDVFITPAGGDSQQALLIVDGEGQPVWESPRAGTRVLNLEEQQYRGQPVLTWYEGSVVNPGVGQGGYVIADSTYRTIARVNAVNGYSGDLHDMTITPQGTALLLIYNPVIVDARSAGGSAQQRVLEPVIQEIDIPTGTLLFEWHGLGSIPLSQSYQPVPKTAADTFDYVHPNSVALDQDGNLLLSGRQTWTVYKIDRLSGALDWRLGGKLDNFTMPKRDEPAWQHDARRNPDGTLSIFDNGAAGATVTHKSRGLVLSIDEQATTAALVHEYPAPPKLQSTSQGSIRPMANGDWFVGWGDQPEFTEFANDGTIVFDVHFPSSSAGTISSYRALKYPWTGHPTDLPAVAAQRGTGAAMTVYASWNGATEVASWNVLAGPDRTHLETVTSGPKHGFETAIHATSNEPYVAVQALDANGAVLATSPVITPRS